jgi:hypothetical protein
MKNEYIIINKTSIQEEIKKLKKEFKALQDTDREIRDKSWDELYAILPEKIHLLEKLLTNNIPLVPVIDEAYEAGKLDKDFSLMFDNPKGRYINSLKFDL